jgi:hypothetical protein
MAGAGPATSTSRVFISHSSEDSGYVAHLAALLARQGYEPWVDTAKLRFGALLRNELRAAIQNSRVLLLIWSAPARRSRWVLSEMFTAFHCGRFIVPCVLDGTPLPGFLRQALYFDAERDRTHIGAKLALAIRDAPHHANEHAALTPYREPIVQRIADTVAMSQIAVLESASKDRRAAIKANKSVREALVHLKALAEADPLVQNLQGFQCKNDYLLRNWDLIMAGQPPADEILLRGERCFFESLCADPRDGSALNGLGSILFYELELDAAEFFQRRAIEIIKKRTGGRYEEAERDLDMVLRQKAAQRDPQ